MQKNTMGNVSRLQPTLLLTTITIHFLVVLSHVLSWCTLHQVNPNSSFILLHAGWRTSSSRLTSVFKITVNLDIMQDTLIIRG